MSNTTPASSRRPVRVWANALIDVFTATRLPPPVNTRGSGITFEAVYNAWACLQDPEDARVSLDIPELRDWQQRQNDSTRTIECQIAAVSEAAFTVMSNLFSSQTAIIAQALYDSGNGLPALSTNPSLVIRAANLGSRIANIILDYHYNDGANQIGNYADTTGYVASNVFNLDDDSVNQAVWDAADSSGKKWLPLRVNGVTQTPFVPHWGRVRPMVMGHGTIHRANLYYFPTQAEIDEVLGYSANLTDERKAIAEYFARGPGTESPPGQWLGIARDVSTVDNNSLDQDVKLFYGVGAAMMDAGIAAWDIKYHYQSIRNITLIRNQYRGQYINAWSAGTGGNANILGNTWVSFGPITDQSPPFPELVSGHSTFGAAAMGVVASLRGSDIFTHNVVFAANSITFDPGYPASNVNLNYANLTYLVRDAGLSRLYKGIHFAQGNDQGQELGKTIAIRVYDHCRGLFKSY